MALTKPPVLPPWAESGDKVQPSNAEIQTGWPLSSIPPSRQRFNWLLNFLANGVRYLTRRGIPGWGSDETYEIGDRVQGPDGLTYKALTNNTNKTPASNPSDWTRWGFTASELGTELNKLDAKASCRVATTANLGALSGLLTIDGVTLVAGNRVLVKDQTTGSQNGIYVAAAGAWSRATDADDGAKLTSGATVPVEEGTANADTLWMLVTDGVVTIGVTSLSFQQVTGGNVGTPGTYNQVTTDARGRVIGGSNQPYPTVQGTFKTLQLSAGGIAASISVSYDELVLGDGSGAYATERNIAGTITTTNTGDGGLDTGTLAASTWYSIWRIGKTDGTRAWLFSLSTTAPTMPSGYTLKARIGWFRTDGTGNKYPLAFIQKDRSWRYVTAISGTNQAKLPTMVSGVQGTSPSTFASVAVGSFVPPTAKSVQVMAADTAAASPSFMLVTPNNSYRYAFGAGTSANVGPLQTNGSGQTAVLNVVGEIVLESTNIYVILGASTCVVNCLGWEDRL